MKKIIAIAMAAMLLLGLAACGEEETPAGGNTQIPNPVLESTADEILETVGYSFNLPEGAEEPTYYIIDEEDAAIAEARFKLDGNDCVYRMRSSVELADITGMYFEWQNQKDVTISYCEGKMAWNDGAEGICYFYDLVPGVLYSATMKSGASEEALTDLANSMFVPATDN